MNIFALKGHKVRVTEETAKNGDSNDEKMVKKNLEIDKIYTVHRTSVHSWHTNVYLEEVAGKFNSVMFEDVVKQSLGAGQLHPGWKSIVEMKVYGVFNYYYEGSSLEKLFFRIEDAHAWADLEGKRLKKEGEEHIADGYGEGVEDHYKWEKIEEGKWRTKTGMDSIFVNELKVE